MMRQMIAQIENYPQVGIIMVLFFFAIFITVITIVYKKANKQYFDQASTLPLNDRSDHE